MDMDVVSLEGSEKCLGHAAISRQQLPVVLTHVVHFKITQSFHPRRGTLG